MQIQRFFILMVALGLCSTLFGQVYVEKQTRHRFAQLALGVDYASSLGGQSLFLNPSGALERFDLQSVGTPRLLIGGTHFWGHADVYIAFPLRNRSYVKNNQEIFHLSGVETVFKYYPWRIEHNKIRPFLGFSFSPFYYEQANTNQQFGDGPDLNHTSLPFHTGVTFNKKNHLFELGFSWNYNNSQDYFISRDVKTEIDTPPFQLSMSYRYFFDTSIGAERNWESGKTKKVTDVLAKDGGLNSFYLGVGLSSSFWLGNSTYNTNNRPYLTKYSTSIMPDFALGYYHHNWDINFGLSYRSMASNTDAYGAVQLIDRQSLGVEITKNLFDYNGFVPFLGPILSRENLGFLEFFEGRPAQDINQEKTALGLTFGWDIRPNRLMTWILRTNLRWYPRLNLAVDRTNTISFSNLEFNFIQLVIYPGRMAKASKKR